MYGQESLNSVTINIYPEEFEEEHEKSNFGCQKGDGENLACHAGWLAQTNQEDGTTKIDLPFSQHQAPDTRGFLFVGGWVELI